MNADRIIKRLESLEGRRAGFEGWWRECSDYVLPRIGASPRRGPLFDSTAPLALGRFAAAMESVLTPRTQKWHSLVTGRDDLDQNPEVGRWLEAVRDLLFAARYSASANFANQMTEAYLSLGVQGTAVLYVDDDPGRGLRYQNIPVHEVYIDEDAAGRVDTVFRLYRLTARQAVQEFGQALPDDILKDAEDPRDQDKAHEFLHVVFPRVERDRGLKDRRNMPVASFHIARQARQAVRESGYRVMPYAVSRFVVAPGEVYGRSPAMEAMPSIVTVNEMQKTILRAGQKAVDPPLLLTDDDVLTGFSLKAGALNYGWLDEGGRPKIQPLQLGGSLPLGLEMSNRERQVINEAFYLNLFQILVESPQKTATEVIERAQEKAQLLAPVMGRQQGELLRPMIEREVDILLAAGAFDALPMPAALAERGGAELRPRYETPMAQAMEAKDGMSIMQAFQAIAGIAQLDPSVLGVVDAEKAGRKVWRGFGAPADVTRTPEELAELKAAQREQASRQQQAQMTLQAAQVLPRAAGEMMKAEQAAQTVREQ